MDGLRVDAVASMLYLDYSRAEGQWVPNQYGGREDLEAVEFIKPLNATLAEEQPGLLHGRRGVHLLAAGDRAGDRGRARASPSSGTWGGCTTPWTTSRLDPIHRRYHHELLTFGMMYEYSEHFIMPLSHDEVVHGKGTLLAKMPGDEWQQFANLRALFAYQYTRPGKPLLFMGSELGSCREWNHDSSLDWHLESRPLNGGLHAIPRPTSARSTASAPSCGAATRILAGFSWLDADDRDHSIYSYFRRDGDRGAARAAQPHSGAAPRLSERARRGPAGTRLVLSSDDPEVRRQRVRHGAASCATEPVAWQNQPASFRIAPPSARRGAARPRPE